MNPLQFGHLTRWAFQGREWLIVDYDLSDFAVFMIPAEQYDHTETREAILAKSFRVPAELFDMLEAL